MRSAQITKDNRAFAQGLALALSDDGRVGPNDAPALRALAKKAGGAAQSIVDQLEAKYEPPSRRDRLAGSGYAREVVAFAPGPGGGFNSNQLSVVLGRPEAAPSGQGSLHVVSLGQGGQITLKLGRAVEKGLAVFENALAHPQTKAALNPEPARVEVSADGHSWHTLTGQAGRNPVFANSLNRIPVRTKAAGGDRFSFKDSGIPAGTKIQYVRITDLGSTSGGPSAPGSTTRGFDLDAVFGY
jgi:hypothetical protein